MHPPSEQNPKGSSIPSLPIAFGAANNTGGPLGTLCVTQLSLQVTPYGDGGGPTVPRTPLHAAPRPDLAARFGACQAAWQPRAHAFPVTECAHRGNNTAGMFGAVNDCCHQAYLIPKSCRALSTSRLVLRLNRTLVTVGWRPGYSISKDSL